MVNFAEFNQKIENLENLTKQVDEAQEAVNVVKKAVIAAGYSELAAEVKEYPALSRMLDSVTPKKPGRPKASKNTEADDSENEIDGVTSTAGASVQV